MAASTVVTDLLARRIVYRANAVQEIVGQGFRVVRTLVLTGEDHFQRNKTPTHFSDLLPNARVVFEQFMFEAALLAARLPKPSILPPGHAWQEASFERVRVAVEPLLRGAVVVGLRFYLLALAPGVPADILDAIANAPARPPRATAQRAALALAAQAAAAAAIAGAGAAQARRGEEDGDEVSREAGAVVNEEERRGPADDGADDMGRRVRARRDAAAGEEAEEAEAAPVGMPGLRESVLRACDLERARVLRVQQALTQAEKRAIRGPEQWANDAYPAGYDYLRQRPIDQHLRRLNVAYFTPLARAFERFDLRPWRAMSIDPSPYVQAHHEINAFCMLDALTYHVVANEHAHGAVLPDMAYAHPSSYYTDARLPESLRLPAPWDADDLPAFRAPPVSADWHPADEEGGGAGGGGGDGEDDAPIVVPEWRRPGPWYQRLRAGMPWLGQAGAPAPDRFPAPETVLVVRHDCLRPELMLPRPLPFRLGQALSMTDYAHTNDILSFVAQPEVRRLMADAMIQRHNIVNPGGDVLATIRDHQRRLADRARVQAAEAEPVTVTADELQDRAGLALLAERTSAMLPLQDRTAAAADERLIDWLLTHRGEMIDQYVDFRQQQAIALFNRYLEQYTDGRYPGLLDRVITMDGGAGGGEGAGDAHERTFLLRLRPGEETMAGMTNDDLYDRAAQMYDEGAGTIDYRVPGMVVFGDEAVVPMQPENELIAEALAALGRSGMWAGTPEQVVKQEACVQLRIIHEAEYLRILQTHAARSDERAAALREFSIRATQRALNVFFTTHVTSPTIVMARTSILRMQQDGLPLRMNIQPSINHGNMLHEALSWLMNTTTGPFQMTSRTITGFLVAFFARLDHMNLRPLNDGRPSPNPLFAGDAAAGKSFNINMIQLLSLPGTVQNASRMTGQALTVGTSNAFAIWIMHEGQPSMFQGDGSNGSGGKGKGGGGGGGNGDSEKLQLMKTMLTEGVLTTVTMVYDDDKSKKKRLTSIVQSLVICVFIVAINWPKRLIDPPLASRLIAYEYKASVEDTGAAPGVPLHQRNTSLEWDASLYDITRDNHLLHAVTFLTNWCISCGALPGGVITDIGELLTTQVQDRLVRDFNLNKSMFGIRTAQNMVSVARAVCMWRVGHFLLSSPLGHSFMSNRELSPFDAETIYDFIFPYMVITVGDIVFTLTLLSFMYDAREDHEILELLSSELYLSAHDPKRQQSLRTYAADLPGTAVGNEYAQRYVTALQLRYDRERHEAAAATAGMDGDAPPAAAQQHHQTHDNDEDEEEVEDAMDLDEPLPAAAAAPAAGHALLPYIDDRALPLPPGPRDIVYDHRYMVIPFKGPSMVKLCENLSNKQLDLMRYRSRPLLIQALLERLMRETIMAPPLWRHPETGVLITIDATKEDRIPVVVVRPQPSSGGMGGGGIGALLDGGSSGGGGGFSESRGERSCPCWLGISVEFLFSRLGIASTAEHVERRARMIEQQGLSREETVLFVRQLTQTPLQRLETPWVQDDEVTAAWANQVAHADVLRHATAMVIRQILSTSTLGRHVPVVPGAPVISPEEHAYTEEYMVYCPPRNWRIRVGDRSRGQDYTTLTVDRYLTLLTVSRAADNNNFMVMANAATIGETAMKHIQATTAPRRPAGEVALAPGRGAPGMIDYLSAGTHTIKLDLDYTYTMRRWQTLGRPRPQWWVTRTTAAGLGPTELPFLLHNTRRMNERLRMPGQLIVPPGQNVAGLMEKGMYPVDDIRYEADRAIRTHRAIAARDFSAMRDLTDYLIDTDHLSFAPPSTGAAGQRRPVAAAAAAAEPVGAAALIGMAQQHQPPHGRAADAAADGNEAEDVAFID